MTFSPPFSRVFPAPFDRREAAAAAAGNGLLNALIAYWPLNEAAGANDALDLHTNGLTLTQVSSPGADTGKVYSTARLLDGIADAFTRNSEALLQTGSVDFTLAVWVKVVTGTIYGMIITKSHPTEYELRLTPGFTAFEWHVGTTWQVFGTVSMGAWTLLVCGYNAATGKSFVCSNDGAVTEKTGTAATANATALNIGRRIDGYYGNLVIGPVAFWKSAPGGGGVLSAAQRTALWNGGAGLAYAAFTT